MARKEKKQRIDVAALIDELGSLRAAESDLGARDKEISAALIGALGEWSRETGLTRNTIKKRIERGWTVAQALKGK